MSKSRSLITACCAAALGLVIATSSLHAWENARRTTYLTFSGPVALPGVQLPPGTYMFELPDPNALDLVRVTSRDRSRVYLFAFTTVIRRPSGLRADQFVSLGEAPAGVAPRITAWYPIAESTGREFRYNR
jgi:hypothetical protein